MGEEGFEPSSPYGTRDFKSLVYTVPPLTLSLIIKRTVVICQEKR